MSCLCCFSSRLTCHLLPRPLPAFLLCQIAHSHISQRTMNGIKLDQIHGGLGAEGEQQSVRGFGRVILVGQAFWLASRRVTKRMKMDGKVQMGTLLGSKSTWTIQDFFASKNWHEKPLFWQSTGNTIGTEGMPSITEHSLEDGREGIVKVTAFRVKHSSSWEALDVSIPTAFSEQNRSPLCQTGHLWGRGSQMAGSPFQRSRGLAPTRSRKCGDSFLTTTIPLHLGPVP